MEILPWPGFFFDRVRVVYSPQSVIPKVSGSLHG